MAPEIEAKEKYVGEQVDIFNAGFILFNMIFQICPFNNAVDDDENKDFHYQWVV